jgi:hypothetical protein
VSCQIRVGSASEAFTAKLGLNAFTVLMINFISYKNHEYSIYHFISSTKYSRSAEDTIYLPEYF